jgi:hypothetical protein
MHVRKFLYLHTSFYGVILKPFSCQEAFRVSKALQREIMSFVLNGIGYMGIVLILYSFAATVTEPWPVIESIAEKTSVGLTLVGVMLTAGLIYLPPAKKPAPLLDFSKVVSAPIVLLASAAAFFGAMFWTVPTTMVNGFAMLGLSGGLIRSLKGTELWTGATSEAGHE